METADNFEKIWEEWRQREDYASDITRHLKTRQRLYNVLAQALNLANKRCPRCLEIGCGTAIDSYVLSDLTGAQCYATDLVEEAIQTGISVGKHFQHTLSFMVNNAMRMCFADDTFDVVYSQGVLEHFDSATLNAVMAEQVRVLRPGGYLIIDVPQKFNWYTLKKHYLIRRGRWPWGYETEFSAQALRRLGESTGLKWEYAIGYKSGRRYNWMRRFPTRMQESKILGRLPLIPLIAQWWESSWSTLESHYGQYFLVCIIGVFRKP